MSAIPAVGGYVYCITNPSMPDLVKIGFTARSPTERLSEANASDTWRPPTDYAIAFAKRVSFPEKKETILHELLEKYAVRVHPRREFFRSSAEQVRLFFELMDGDWWEPESEDDDTASTSTSSGTPPGCRIMARCFSNGQRIRHLGSCRTTWIGTYDLTMDAIIYEARALSLNRFVCQHYRADRPDRTSSANAWSECECEVNGAWISTFALGPA